jgi:hypothetical protein
VRAPWMSFASKNAVGCAAVAAHERHKARTTRERRTAALTPAHVEGAILYWTRNGERSPSTKPQRQTSSWSAPMKCSVEGAD